MWLAAVFLPRPAQRALQSRSCLCPFANPFNAPDGADGGSTHPQGVLDDTVLSGSPSTLPSLPRAYTAGRRLLLDADFGLGRLVLIGRARNALPYRLPKPCTIPWPRMESKPRATPEARSGNATPLPAALQGPPSSLTLRRHVFSILALLTAVFCYPEPDSGQVGQICFVSCPDLGEGAQGCVPGLGQVLRNK